MNKLFLVVLVGLFLLTTIVSAEESFLFQKGANSTIDVSMANNDLSECLTCTCEVSIFDPDGNTIVKNVAGTNVDGYCQYNITIDEIGVYGGEIIANNGVDYGRVTFGIEVTYSGDNYTTSDSITNVALIIFFFLLILGVYVLNKNIDFNKWNNSIIGKYENKNYVKLVLSSITYNIMKNSFVIYYILILPILLLIMNIAYTSSNVSMIQFLPSLIVVYIVGFIIIGIYFFGYVQEWLMNLLEEFRDSDWGVGR